MAHFISSQLLARRAAKQGKDGEVGNSNPTITESPPRKEPVGPPLGAAVVPRRRKVGSTSGGLSGGVLGLWRGGAMGEGEARSVGV